MRCYLQAFHVFHISCLIHWVLFCEYEVCTKQIVGPTIKKRCRRKKGAAKVIETEDEVKKQIYSPFCPECQGTGIDIDGNELEKPTVSLSEVGKSTNLHHFVPLLFMVYVCIRHLVNIAAFERRHSFKRVIDY